MDRRIRWACLDRDCVERVLCLDLRNDAVKGRKLGSVLDVYEERSYGRGGSMKLLYAFLPTLPGESGTFADGEHDFSHQYISRFQTCLRHFSTLFLFSKLPDTSRLRWGSARLSQVSADMYVGRHGVWLTPGTISPSPDANTPPLQEGQQFALMRMILSKQATCQMR